jgi:hypothetical protein
VGSRRLGSLEHLRIEMKSFRTTRKIPTQPTGGLGSLEHLRIEIKSFRSTSKIIHEEEDEEGGEECSKVSIPTVSDALEAIRIVNLFYESRGGSSEIVTICLGYCESAHFGYNDTRL